MAISLSKEFGEDAAEVKGWLEMFSSPGKRDAELVNVGVRHEVSKL